jgi:hypothetical protein
MKAARVAEIGRQRIANTGRAMRSSAVAGLLAVCSAFVSSAPAAGADPPVVVQGSRYMPLQLGREMRYQVTVSPPLGKPREATATNKMAEQVVLKDKTYFKVTTTITGVPFMPDTLIYYRHAPAGVYQVLEGDEKSPEWLYLPAKIKIGDQWGAETPSGNYQFTAAAFEDVETPGRSYPKCLKLKVTMKKTLVTNTEEQWLAPGVGVVKQTDSNTFFSSTSFLKEVKEGAPKEGKRQP